MASPDDHVKELQIAVDAHCQKFKGRYLEQCTATSELLLVWIAYLRSSVSRNVADRLLDAAQATIIEVAGCLSVGMVRPAIFSIRTQLELLLAWIYFNDHPVEWHHIEKAIDEYPMRAVLLKYLRSNDLQFSDRMKSLEATKKRKMDDPYGLLSVHVHSTSAFAAPKVGKLSELVRDKKTCDECIEIQAAVAEYLTDILAAWYAARWQDFPKAIQDHIKTRLSAPTLKEFCKI